MTDTLVLSAGYQLRALAGALADAVVALEFARRPTLRTRYGAEGRSKSRQDAVYHLAYLADAVDADSPALFKDYIGWAKVLLLQRHVRSEDLDHHLACMVEVLREQLPPPVAAPAVAMIEAARAAMPLMPDTTASFLASGHRLSPLARDYAHSLLGGYRQAAGELVFDAAWRGESVRDLYLHVLQPALYEIGRLWQMKLISVAQEHFCSVATQMLMSQLLRQARATERCGGVVVVACVAGDMHDMGARMLGDFFEMAGWDTYSCGANTPDADLVQVVADRAADVLAISATMGYHLHVVRELIDAVRADARCKGLRIMVGGRPFNIDPALWRVVGADGSAADAGAAVALAEQWLNACSPSA